MRTNAFPIYFTQKLMPRMPRPKSAICDKNNQKIDFIAIRQDVEANKDQNGSNSHVLHLKFRLPLRGLRCRVAGMVSYKDAHHTILQDKTVYSSCSERIPE